MFLKRKGCFWLMHEYAFLKTISPINTQHDLMNTYAQAPGFKKDGLSHGILQRGAHIPATQVHTAKEIQQLVLTTDTPPCPFTRQVNTLKLWGSTVSSLPLFTHWELEGGSGG